MKQILGIEKIEEETSIFVDSNTMIENENTENHVTFFCEPVLCFYFAVPPDIPMIFVKKKNYEDNLRPPASASSSKHHHAASTTTDRVNTNRSLNGKYLFDQMPKEMPFSGSRSKCFEDSVLDFELF